MSLRVSQLIVRLVVLNEHDAPQNADPIVFQGDADGTAADKLREWLDDLPDQLKEASVPGGSST